ncbi:unnamed protein product [Camellia sinensis]
MADALSVIPPAVLRNLSDKLYEKRKNAALEIEGIVKQLAAAGEHDKITAVINLLANEFTYSAQVNHRKGGLIGLATATVALTGEAAQHLEVWEDNAPNGEEWLALLNLIKDINDNAKLQNFEGLEMGKLTSDFQTWG